MLQPMVYELAAALEESGIATPKQSEAFIRSILRQTQQTEAAAARNRVKLQEEPITRSIKRAFTGK